MFFRESPFPLVESQFSRSQRRFLRDPGDDLLILGQLQYVFVNLDGFIQRVGLFIQIRQAFLSLQVFRLSSTSVRWLRWRPFAGSSVSTTWRDVAPGDCWAAFASAPAVRSDDPDIRSDGGAIFTAVDSGQQLIGLIRGGYLARIMIPRIPVLILRDARLVINHTEADSGIEIVIILRDHIEENAFGGIRLAESVLGGSQVQTRAVVVRDDGKYFLGSVFALTKSFCCRPYNPCRLASRMVTLCRRGSSRNTSAPIDTA